MREKEERHRDYLRSNSGVVLDWCLSWWFSQKMTIAEFTNPIARRERKHLREGGVCVIIVKVYHRVWKG